MNYQCTQTKKHNVINNVFRPPLNSLRMSVKRYRFLTSQDNFHCSRYKVKGIPFYSNVDIIIKANEERTRENQFETCFHRNLANFFMNNNICFSRICVIRSCQYGNFFSDTYLLSILITID